MLYSVSFMWFYFAKEVRTKLAYAFMPYRVRLVHVFIFILHEIMNHANFSHSDYTSHTVFCSKIGR